MQYAIQLSETRHCEFIHAWRGTIDELYRLECLDNVPPPHKEPTAFAWMWDLCRELRLMARALDGGTCRQYAYCLSAYLLPSRRFWTTMLQIGQLQAEILGQAYLTAGRVLVMLSHNGARE